MIHLTTLNPALDLDLALAPPRTGKLGRVAGADLEAGGKALNLARFLGRWGRRPALWLGSGGGSHPTHLLYRSLLKRERLKARFLGGEAPIRINVVVRRGSGAVKYNQEGSEWDLKGFAALDRSLSRGDLLVLTGSLPSGMNPGLYKAWTLAFQRRGIKIVLDSSGRPLREALSAKPWFLKVNLSEMGGALGTSWRGLASILPHLPKWIGSGLLQGAVTHGAEGAVLWNGNQALWVRSRRPVRSPLVVGAGDAFLAGYLKGSGDKASFADCARLACASGAAVALAGIKGFEPKVVSALMDQVELRRI